MRGNGAAWGVRKGGRRGGLAGVAGNFGANGQRLPAQEASVVVPWARLG